MFCLVLILFFYEARSSLPLASFRLSSSPNMTFVQRHAHLHTIGDIDCHMVKDGLYCAPAFSSFGKLDDCVLVCQDANCTFTYTLIRTAFLFPWDIIYDIIYSVIIAIIRIWNDLFSPTSNTVMTLVHAPTNGTSVTSLHFVFMIIGIVYSSIFIVEFFLWIFAKGVKKRMSLDRLVRKIEEHFGEKLMSTTWQPSDDKVVVVLSLLTMTMKRPDYALLYGHFTEMDELNIEMGEEPRVEIVRYK